MTLAEFDAWQRQASPGARAAVARDFEIALFDWLSRIATVRELADIAWCSVTPLLYPSVVASRAACAAAELAVVCSAWPTAPMQAWPAGSFREPH
jgi:hypothetical protein